MSANEANTLYTSFRIFNFMKKMKIEIFSGLLLLSQLSPVWPSVAHRILINLLQDDEGF